MGGGERAGRMGAESRKEKEMEAAREKQERLDNKGLRDGTERWGRRCSSVSPWRGGRRRYVGEQR